MEINKIYRGDCRQGLKALPGESVDCCVTSPPYFGLRDYGHQGQIGLEETPEMFVAKMVEVFTEVRRVLKPTGTLWLNLGDSYAGGGGGNYGSGLNVNAHKTNPSKLSNSKALGVKTKDLIGIPWMVAFALRSSGWYLRQDIIWHKPNPMPESVKDRCTKAHEYIFLMSKSGKYYYNVDAIKQPHKDISVKRWNKGGENTENTKYEKEKPNTSVGNLRNGSNPLGEFGANKRSVWTVTTKPFKDAHFATFPEDLIIDCIKAGCPENGIVLDPFMGAGTTALVATKLNRNFIGFELNADYVKIAENRINKHLLGDLY